MLIQSCSTVTQMGALMFVFYFDKVADVFCVCFNVIMFVTFCNNFSFKFFYIYN